MTKQTRWLGTAQVSKKRKRINYLKREGFQGIKYRISNRLKVSSKWINNNTRKEILNNHYYVENGIWLCDKSIRCMRCKQRHQRKTMHRMLVRWQFKNLPHICECYRGWRSFFRNAPRFFKWYYLLLLVLCVRFLGRWRTNIRCIVFRWWRCLQRMYRIKSHIF